MQDLIDVYVSNINTIEKFLIETISNIGSLSIQEEKEFKKLFKIFPSLELIYVCDEKNLIQTSPNIYRKKITQSSIGKSRKYLLNKLNFGENGIAISQPYISSATGDMCVTVAKKEKNKIYCLDFNLIILLQRLGLIEVHKEFNYINKGFYFLTAGILAILAIFVVGYASFSFIHSIFFQDISIETIFKPIIALTLGVAIYDLTKTILEQEVIFKSYSKDSKAEYKVLIKFAISIIIALLIESLMMVFNVALHSYEQMIYPFYLISGISLLIVALGAFIFLSKKNSIKTSHIVFKDIDGKEFGESIF